MADALNACNGVTDGPLYIANVVSPPVAINNPCFLQTSDTLSFYEASGVLSIEFPSLTSVGFAFQVILQAHLTRIVLPELHTVVDQFVVSENVMLTFLSAPKIRSTRAVEICGNSEAFALPSTVAGTWPAINPDINIEDTNSFCTFVAGNTPCNTDVCSALMWP